MIDNRTGTVVGTGKVVAWDGHIAAPQLAVEIMKIFRTAHPLPRKEWRRVVVLRSMFPQSS
jgi:hypothetical protein